MFPLDESCIMTCSFTLGEVRKEAVLSNAANNSLRDSFSPSPLLFPYSRYFVQKPFLNTAGNWFIESYHLRAAWDLSNHASFCVTEIKKDEGLKVTTRRTGFFTLESKLIFLLLRQLAPKGSHCCQLPKSLTLRLTTTLLSFSLSQEWNL